MEKSDGCPIINRQDLAGQVRITENSRANTGLAEESAAAARKRQPSSPLASTRNYLPVSAGIKYLPCISTVHGNGPRDETVYRIKLRNRWLCLVSKAKPGRRKREEKRKSSAVYPPGRKWGEGGSVTRALFRISAQPDRKFFDSFIYSRTIPCLVCFLISWRGKLAFIHPKWKCFWWCFSDYECLKGILQVRSENFVKWDVDN